MSHEYPDSVFVDVAPLPDTFQGRTAADYNGKWAGVVDDSSGGFIGFVREEEALLLQRCMRYLRYQHPITGKRLTPAEHRDRDIDHEMMSLALCGDTSDNQATTMETTMPTTDTTDIASDYDAIVTETARAIIDDCIDEYASDPDIDSEHYRTIEHGHTDSTLNGMPHEMKRHIVNTSPNAMAAFNEYGGHGDSGDWAELVEWAAGTAFEHDVADAMRRILPTFDGNNTNTWVCA